MFESSGIQNLFEICNVFGCETWCLRQRWIRMCLITAQTTVIATCDVKLVGRRKTNNIMLILSLEEEINY